MYKKVIILSIGLLVSDFTLAAGPFGLSMGMKKSELKGELKEVAPFKYQVTTVPKGHSAFESYVLRFGPKSGLCYIKAIGKDIATNTYGLEVKSKFDSVESKLKKAYGKNNRQDFLRSGSIWDESKDWMPGLIKGERILAAYWDKEEGSKLKDNLNSIILSASGSSRESGYITIDYSFTNNEKCKAEIADTEDDAL